MTADMELDLPCGDRLPRARSGLPVVVLPDDGTLRTSSRRSGERMSRTDSPADRVTSVRWPQTG